MACREAACPRALQCLVLVASAFLVGGLGAESVRGRPPVPPPPLMTHPEFVKTMKTMPLGTMGVCWGGGWLEIQGYLAHKNHPPVEVHNRFLGLGLL